MAEKELRRMSRPELIEIIYALKSNEESLQKKNAIVRFRFQRHQSKAIAAYDEKVSEMKPEDYTKYFEAAERVRTVLFPPTVVCRAQSFLQTSIKWK